MKTLKIILASLFLAMAFPFIASASPSTFCVDGMTTGTTSPVNITPGTATTTLTTNNCVSSTFTLNSLVFIGQMAASSTNAILTGTIQDSYDGVDWYDRAPNEQASSTQAFGFNNGTLGNTFVYKFASTTQNRVAVTNANSATSTFAIVIRPFLKYTRVIVSNTSGAAVAPNFYFWGKLIGIRESNQTTGR